MVDFVQIKFEMASGVMSITIKNIQTYMIPGLDGTAHNTYKDKFYQVEVERF